MRRLPDVRLLFQPFPCLNVLAFAPARNASTLFPSFRFFSASPAPTPPTAFTARMTEMQKDGSSTEGEFSLEELLKLMRKERLTLPPRDLKIFFRTNLEAASATCVMTRPKTKCFLLELEHIRLICLRDKCLVLHPEWPIVRDFIEDLSQKCANPDTSSHSNYDKEKKKKINVKPTVQEFHRLLTNDIQSMDFEHVVLEQVLSNISARFSRHVWLTKPALELLLLQISQDPSGSMLRRLLAFRKSLGEFESSVQQVHRVLEALLTNDEDLIGLYLTNPDRQINDHHEVELLIEAYYHDLSDVICEIRNMKDMVEETNQFINTHLDTVRNSMIRMSLFMEMGTLSLATGAVIAGVFGMNLQHGAEESNTAFYITSGTMMAFMLVVFGTAASKYNRLVADTTRAHSFKALKNFFHYVDELDLIFESRGQESLSKAEFKDVLCRLTGTPVTDEETDFIFRMFDTNKDGKLLKSEVNLGDARKTMSFKGS